jgi:hypothetical protein
VPVEALKGKSQRVNDAVTVKWVVPEIRLDSYVIRYGFDMRNLDYEERVLWGTLRTESDELGRKIFAHTLRGLPPEETIYLSMAGELDGKLSAPSPIFSIQPLAAK